MGRVDRVAKTARMLMEEERLDRLVCEIDTDNKLAINLARRVGMQPVGVVRDRKRADGSRHSVLMLDALPGDLNG